MPLPITIALDERLLARLDEIAARTWRTRDGLFHEAVTRLSSRDEGAPQNGADTLLFPEWLGSDDAAAFDDL